MTWTKRIRTTVVWGLLAMAVGWPLPAAADGVAGRQDSGAAPAGADSRPGSGEWLPQGVGASIAAGAFAGKWYAFVDNTAFTVLIEQDGNVVKGAHTAVFDYGRRIDSSAGSVSIVGTVQGATAYVTWTSGLSQENGRATLEILPGKPAVLRWKILDAPPREEEPAGAAEVAYFLPRTAFLLRK